MPHLSNRPPQMLRYAGDKARVYLNGKQHYLGKWGSDQAKAKYNQLITAWRKEQAIAAVPAEERYLVSELAADYIQHLLQYFGTGHNRATSIRPVIRRFGLHFGDMWTDEFSPKHLKQARQLWIDRGCTRVYCNRSVREIVRCFKWGVEEEKVPAPVWQALQSVEPLRLGRYGVPEAEDVQPVPLETIDATLPLLPAVVADMVRIQLLSGCRPNEIMRMSPGEIDRSADVWKYRPVKHKNAWRKKRRTIYLGPQAQAILAKYLFRGDADPCFTTKDGKAFARGGYRQVIKRAIKNHNEQAEPTEQIEHWTPNQLRHTKATELRRMRNLEAARAILGHGSDAVTRIYAELNEEPALELARHHG